MAGPIVAALFGALEGAVLLGGASALGAALTTIGVSKELVIRYETALKADKYVLIMHGNSQEVAKARAVLQSTDVQPSSSAFMPVWPSHKCVTHARIAY